MRPRIDMGGSDPHRPRPQAERPVADKMSHLVAFSAGTWCASMTKNLGRFDSRSYLVTDA
jgi:hypothetical protein